MQNRNCPIGCLNSQYVEDNFNRLLLYTTMAFFLFLVIVLIVFGYTPQNDSEGYIEHALLCLKAGQPYPCEYSIVGQPFNWNIGQINLIALSLKLFGTFYPVLIVMCAMKAATLWLVGKLTRHLFSPAIALLAVVLYFLYPNNWGQSTMLLSEIPMVFFGLLSLWLALRYDKTAILFLSGLLMAVANWFRPVAMVYFGSLLLYLLIFFPKTALRRLPALALGYGFMIILIGSSCYLRTRHFVYQSETLWFNMSEAIYETSSEPHYDTEMFPKGTPRYIENMQEKTCFQCDSIWRERSIEWLRAHPVDYLKKIPVRLAYLLYSDIDNIAAFGADKSNAADNNVTLPYRNMITQFGSLSGMQRLATISLLFYYALLLMAAAAVFSMLRRRRFRQLFLPLFILVGGSLAIVLAVHGEPRFKAPLMPFLFMLAAAVRKSN